MAANTVWGIEIGQCALKAVRCRAAEDGKVEVLGFDVIEHDKILSQPDADADALISDAMEKFAERNEWQKDRIVLGVPGQLTFARFTRLPPVDQKKIASIVGYEAGQQIPFAIEDVVWDYTVFSDTDSPETEVGIFAMRKDLVRKYIDYLTRHRVNPVLIQTIPSALYNFAHFEMAPKEDDQAVVVIDVGAQNTDLVVVERNGAWTRNIPLGGNNFTDALTKSFKLSFSKAEELKRQAASHKYARQIFQAMRPVFADLVAEIQRSLGFYSSTHRDVEITRVMVMGNAFRLPGLQKYLETNLTIGSGVGKLDSFETLAPSEATQAEQFKDNLLTFGSAYGLALQGLGLGKIEANLLPPDMARVLTWKRKTPYWIGVAAVLVFAAIAPWSRNAMDSAAFAAETDPARTQAQQIVRTAEQNQRALQSATKDPEVVAADVNRILELRDQNQLIPRIIALVHQSLPEVDPRLASPRNRAALQQELRMNPNLRDRTQRGLMFIDDLDITYHPNLESYVPADRSSGGGRGRDRGQSVAAAGGEGGGFYVELSGRLLWGREPYEPVQFIENRVYKNLQDFGRQPGLGFYVLTDDGPRQRFFESPRVNRYTDRRDENRRGGDDGPPIDPMTGESMEYDWAYEFSFRVKLGDPPPVVETETGDA